MIEHYFKDGQGPNGPDKLTLNLRALGWTRTFYDHRYGGPCYHNSAFPGSSVRTGGGWSIQGEPLYALSHGKNLDASDYNVLIAFLKVCNETTETASNE